MKSILYRLLALVCLLGVIVPASGQERNGAGTTASSDANVSSFIAANSITSPTTAGALNNLVSVFKTAGRYGNVVDVILLGNQFNPTNSRTLMGRTWSTVSGTTQPSYANVNYANFCGTNGIQLTGLSLTNWTVFLVTMMDPSMYAEWDNEIYAGSGNVNYFHGLLWSLGNPGDNSGVFCSLDGLGGGSGSGTMEALWPHTGANTNSWYNGGFNPALGGPEGSTNYMWAVSTKTIYRQSLVLRHSMAFLGSTNGIYQGYFDAAPGLFNGYYGKGTNFASTIIPTNGLTTFQLGADTNFLGTYRWPSGASAYASTNALIGLQVVMLFNTNDPALIPLAQKAAYYADSRRTVFTHYGTSIWDENQRTAAIGGASLTTNGMAEILQSRNPQMIVQNISQGGAWIGSLLTNQATSSAMPLTAATTVPAEFGNVISTDLHYNEFLLWTNNGAGVNTLLSTAFGGAVKTNGIPLWVWEDHVLGTNAASPVYNILQMSNMLRFYATLPTNTLIARHLNMARRVTNGTLTNSAIDSVHMVANGMGYAECVDEVNNTGPVKLRWPDSYTVASTGWTNYTAQVLTISMTAATGLQIFDPDNTTKLLSTATVTTLTTFDLPPLGYFTGTAITAKAVTRYIQ